VNLLKTVEHYKASEISAEVLACFLTEEYKENELTFFLFLRYMVEKTLKISFFNSKAFNFHVKGA
jgi:hypothetical protein